MSEIIAIGEKDQVIGFLGVGVTIAPVKTHDEFADALKDACRRDGVEIILVTENFAENAGEKLLADTRKSTNRVILVIPDHHGSRGTAFRKMRADVERALGVDMLGKGE
ncbi:MAG TPA: V-type ATP synthase subunit F [Planctomycetota bacterium]|nr:V-type ATP synthase subunit F [Planctomycetota bacterium]